MDSKIINDIRKIAESFFKTAKVSHNWEHTLRVTSMCQHIGKVEGADMEALLCAAYLHDIGREYQDSSNGLICHAKKGAELSEPFIKNLPFDESRKKNIIDCIKTHRFRGMEEPETLEAKILFDADKLDSIGAIGIARAFLFAGEIGARLHQSDTDIEKTYSYSSEDTGYREFKVKLSKIKNRMFTNEGKRIANERDAFMNQFFERFIQELERNK